LFRLGNYQSALEYTTKAKEIAYTVKKDKLMVSTYSLIGTIYRKKGDIDNSLKYYNQAIDIIDCIDAANLDREMYIVYFNLGTLYEQLEDKENLFKAQYTYVTLIDIMEQVITVAETNDFIEQLMALCKGSLGKVYNILGNYDLAIEMQQQSVNSLKKVCGEENPKYLTSLHNLALSFFGREEYTKAIELHKQIIAVKTKILHENHEELLLSKSALASSFVLSNQLDSGRELLKEVLVHSKVVYPENHPTLAIRMSNYAQFCKDKDEALLLHSTALEITKNCYGDTNPNTAKILLGRAKTYFEHKDFEYALNDFEGAYLILKNNFGIEHELTVLSLNYINVLKNI